MTAYEAIPNRQCLNFYYHTSPWSSRYADYPKLHSYNQLNCQQQHLVDSYVAYPDECSYVSRNAYSIASVQECCWGWGSVHFNEMQSISVLVTVTNETFSLPSLPTFSPTVLSSSNQSSSTKSSIPISLIVGCVFGFLVFVFLLFTLYYCLCRRENRSSVEVFGNQPVQGSYQQIPLNTLTSTLPSAPLSPDNDIEMIEKHIPVAYATSLPQNNEAMIVIEANQVHVL